MMKYFMFIGLIFTLSVFGLVTVITPNGGETLTRGDQYEIMWSDDISEDVKIELYKGGVYNSDITSATPSDGSFSWAVPISLYGVDFQIKISSTVMPALHSDLSDTTFTIEREAGVIEIIYPDGSEILNRGSMQEIFWTDNFPEKVKIELYHNDMFFSAISDSTESDGIFDWTVPADIFGDFKIKITSIKYDFTNDISSSAFTINKGSVSILSPQAGETLEMFSTRQIEWSDNIPENVNITLLKNSVTVAELSLKSTGTHEWDFYTPDIISGTDYSLKIESELFEDVSCETGYFTIKGTNNINNSVNGTWIEENSPYILTDSTYISSGYTLTVEPGVKIVGHRPEEIFNIEGKIDAVGEFDNRISIENINLDFNSADPDTSRIINSNIEMINKNYFFEKTPSVGRGYSMQQTSDFGYIITGEKNGDVLLLKTDSRGNQIWSKTFGGTNDDRGYSVSQTENEGFIITGYTKSYGSGGQDVWLIKTDVDGNEVWNKTFGGTLDDSGYSVILSSNSGYILTGYTRSYGTSNSNDVWVIKTDSEGNEEWNKTFGGTDHDSGKSIRSTSDGNYIITGAIDYDVCLLKIDSDGNEVWSKTFSGLNYDSGNSVLQTSDNGYIMSCTKDINGVNDYVWLIKTDSLGAKEWDKVYESGKYFIAESICQTAEGGYIVGCHHYQGSLATLLIKTESDGNEEWSKFYNYADIYNFQLILSVIQSNDNGYVFTGYANENVILTKTDQNGNVKYDDIAVEINDNSKVIMQNNIIHNLQNYGITINNSNPVISNNLIAGNKSGIKFINSSPLFIVNNTIADNDSIGLFFDGNSDGQFVNNIIYGNKVIEVYINSDLSDPAFYYNDIRNGQAGFGLNSGVVYSGTYANNINSDPEFIGGSYYLSEASPCINSGYPGLTEELLGTMYIPQADILGNLRIFSDEIDIGCHEWNASGIVNEKTIENITLSQNYPNPFNPVTQIKFALSKTADVKLSIYNIRGQLVSQPAIGTMNAGHYAYDFDGSRLNSGIYYYTLEVDGKAITKKMALIK